MNPLQQQVRAEKAELRRRMLHERSLLTPNEVAERSLAARRRLENIEAFRSARTVLTYVAALDNELDTKPLIAGHAGSRSFLVPVMAKGRQLRWSEVHNVDELTPNAYGVPEPRPEFMREVSPSPHAVVLVPGLAFTTRGDRIGFGGGYYDRFLAFHPGPKIGLAFDFQVLPACPHELHDVLLDYVVTESAIYPCKEKRQLP